METLSQRAPPRSNDSGTSAPGDWHALDAEQVLEALDTTPDGINEREAEERLSRYGPNRLPEAKSAGPLRRLLRQFHNLLIYVLIASAAVSVVLGHGTDALVILAVVILNAAIGFYQEGRAEHAISAIRRMMSPRASVMREGRRVNLDAENIVPGDAVVIEAGDRVPADLRLLRARNLRIDESALTGESVAVDKATPPAARDAALGDRTSMAYSGTLVATGYAIGVAIATGPQTELGRIGTLIGSVEALRTPLLRQVDAFAKQLTYAILVVSAAAFLFAYFLRAYGVDEAFMIVVGLAVAAIPEGLPAVMTITLAIGVQRMASRRAIVRRLPAVETLGSVSIICSDKTGTLTRNEMTVRAVATADARYDATGVGYAPEGTLEKNGDRVETNDEPVLGQLARAGLLCNDAQVERRDGLWHVSGDPMEGALVTLARKGGYDPHAERARFPRTDEIPFDAAHRFMATLHRGADGEGLIVVKGAPEKVIGMCRAERSASGDRPIDPEAWHRRADELAAQGQRVLAVAAKAATPEQGEIGYADVGEDLVLLGLTGFIDPPREEAIAAVAECRCAGIRVLMITGDHAVTAGEIARQLGISENPRVLTGHDVDGLDDEVLVKAVRETDVFARTSPEHKLRLVNALQGDGTAIAMTGDGVNDAPALKRAAVGIAMGEKGTEAAKEASEIVLADDNFASIVAAVREGRTVYDNLMKVVAWTLPTNGGEAATILIALGLGLALPITPVQILWVNMVTAVALGLTLAFEPTEPGTMRRPPRPPGKPILSGELVWRIAFVSALFVCGTFGLFYWAEQRGLPIEAGRTMVVNALVVFEVFYLFSVRYVHGTSLTPIGVIGTPAVLAGVAVVFVAQLALTYTPFLQRVFETRPLAFTDGAVIVGAGIVLLVLAEGEKRLRGRLLARAGPRMSRSGDALSRKA